jgi:hypothetical protein
MITVFFFALVTTAVGAKVRLCSLDGSRGLMHGLACIAVSQHYMKPVKGEVLELSRDMRENLPGNYKFADGTLVNISVGDNDGMLVASIGSRFAAELIPLSDKEFYVPLVDGKAEFLIDAHDRAASLVIYYSGMPAKGPAPNQSDTRADRIEPRD